MKLVAQSSSNKNKKNSSVRFFAKSRPVIRVVAVASGIDWAADNRALGAWEPYGHIVWGRGNGSTGKGSVAVADGFTVAIIFADHRTLTLDSPWSTRGSIRRDIVVMAFRMIKGAAILIRAAAVQEVQAYLRLVFSVVDSLTTVLRMRGKIEADLWVVRAWRRDSGHLFLKRAKGEKQECWKSYGYVIEDKKKRKKNQERRTNKGKCATKIME